MSSEYNSFTVGNGGAIGRWEDVQKYTTVALTVNTGPTSGAFMARQLTLYWSLGNEDSPPADPTEVATVLTVPDYMTTDTFILGADERRYFEVPIRARWLLAIVKEEITSSITVSVTTNYKVASTAVSLIDNTFNANGQEIVKVGNIDHALHTALTDACGHFYSVSNRQHPNNALYTTLSDGSANALGSEMGSLRVTIRDSSNTAIKSTGPNNADYVTNMFEYTPHDVVITINHSYDMCLNASNAFPPSVGSLTTDTGANLTVTNNNPDISATKLHSAYRDIARPIFNYMRDAGAFKGVTPSRFTIISYGRLDISLDGTPTTPNTGRARKIVPGNIEISSTSATEIDNCLTIFADIAMTKPTLNNGSPAGGKGLWIGTPGTDFYKLAIGGRSLNDALINDDPKTLLRPGGAFYTTMNRVLTLDNAFTTSKDYNALPLDASGVGNAERISVPSSGISTYWTVLPNLTYSAKRVLINITGAQITDDLEPGHYSVLERGALTYSDAEIANSTTQFKPSRIFANARNKLTSIFGNNIYNIILNPPTIPADYAFFKVQAARLVDPSGLSTYAITGGNLNPTTQAFYDKQVALARIVPITDKTPSGITAAISPVIDRALKITLDAHNAMSIRPTDSHGTGQAGTTAIADARYAGQALYYALADGSGAMYSTTYAQLDTSVAMAVHATDVLGKSIDLKNGTPVIFTSKLDRTRLTFDSSLSGDIVSLAGLTNHHFTLKSLAIANESPDSLWIKVYDMSAGLNTAPTDMSGAKAAAVRFNVPVPPLSFRDLPFTRGVAFSNGLHARASLAPAYDISFVDLGDAPIYLNGTYSDAVSNS